MAELTEAEVVRDLALKTQAPTIVQAGKRYAWHNPEGDFDELDLTGDPPARKTGKVIVQDVASFLEYWGKHSDSGSELFADPDEATITAVLDAHHGGGPRWQEHRLVLKLTETLAWETWTEFDRKMLPQRQFAEFLEDNYQDLAPAGETIHVNAAATVPNVSAADFLDLAQKLYGTTTATFGSGTRLANGDVTIAYEETTKTQGGKGSIDVPAKFLLAIAPFDDCETPRISARFRTANEREAGMRVGYFLDQPDRVRRDAIDEVIAKVSAATERTIMLGQPS